MGASFRASELQKLASRDVLQFLLVVFEEPQFVVFTMDREQWGMVKDPR
jgi:hypothetical protein